MSEFTLRLTKVWLSWTHSISSVFVKHQCCKYWLYTQHIYWFPVFLAKKAYTTFTLRTSCKSFASFHFPGPICIATLSSFFLRSSKIILHLWSSIEKPLQVNWITQLKLFFSTVWDNLDEMIQNGASGSMWAILELHLQHRSQFFSWTTSRKLMKTVTRKQNLLDYGKIFMGNIWTTPPEDIWKQPWWEKLYFGFNFSKTGCRLRWNPLIFSASLIHKNIDKKYGSGQTATVE